MEIVKKLMTHVDKAEAGPYRDELLTKIIDICSQSNYQHITNFEWCGPGGRRGRGRVPVRGQGPFADPGFRQVYIISRGTDAAGRHPPRPPHCRTDAGCGHPRKAIRRFHGADVCAASGQRTWWHSSLGRAQRHLRGALRLPDLRGVL